MELAALQAALPVEQRVLGGLILISPPARLPGEPTLNDLLSRRGDQESKPSAFRLLHDTITRELPESSLREAARALALTPMAASASDLAASEAFVDLDAAGRVDIPTLVLAGATDRVAPVHQARELERRIRGSRMIVLEGVGHHPPLEATNEVAAHIVAFLDAIDVPSGGAEATTAQPETA